MPNIKTLLDKALMLQNKKKLEEAHSLFNAILKIEPENIDALHGLALNLAIRKSFKEAIPFFIKAIQNAPFIPAFHNNLANTYKAIGDLKEAQRHYCQALSIKPNYPEAHNNLGNLLVQQGEINTAIEHFQTALRINPHAIDAHYNLANCYIRSDRLLDAIPHFEITLAAWPTHVGAHHNLGITQCALKQFQYAKSHLDFVISQEPENIDALFHLGIIYTTLDQLEKSKTIYHTLLKIRPQHAEAHHNLATLLLQLNDSENALTHFETAYKLMPQNKTAEHMIQALKQVPTTDTAPQAYISALFDQYAYSYDEHVKSTLNFQVPRLLREAITPFAETKENAWTVLDLGCGTGLIMPYFNDIADKLYGVDLSSNMIELAKQQGGYLQLFNEDISSFLRHTCLSFDLMIASDVFVYCGDLSDIFLNCYQKLKENAYLCFSIENLKNTTQPYQVQPTGRFCHSIDYIESLLNNKFTIKYQYIENIRNQNGTHVEGVIYVLQKINI